MFVFIAFMKMRDGFVMIVQKNMNVAKIECFPLLILQGLEFADIVGEEV